MNNESAFIEMSMDELYMIEGGVDVVGVVGGVGAVAGCFAGVCPPAMAVSLVCASFCLGYALAK